MILIKTPSVLAFFAGALNVFLTPGDGRGSAPRRTDESFAVVHSCICNNLKGYAILISFQAVSLHLHFRDLAKGIFET